MPTGLTHAVKQQVKKGEDAYSVLKGGQDKVSAGCFGVFDGHGGTKASSHGAGKLAPTLQALGASASDVEIQDAFWAADSQLGTQKIQDGSTATVLLVDDDGASGLTGVLAWVGDSQGVLVDLNKSTPVGGAHIVCETTKHTATNPDEEARLQNTWQVRRQLRFAVAAATKEGGAPLDPEQPSAEQVAAAAAKAGLTLSDADASLTARTIGRGYHIDHAKYGMMDLTDAKSSVLAPRVPGGKAFLHKVSTPVVEVQAASSGAAAATSAKSPSRSSLERALDDKGRLNSVSTAVTRALGDWDGSRALVPHPEIHRFAVAPDACYRAVLASDGLWDLLEPAEAAAVLCEEPDADECVYRLQRMAVERSNRIYNELKDDLTIVCVQMNPSGAPPPLLPKPKGGCCVLS